MTAVLFPGQGAYYGRALLDLQETYPEVRPVFADIEGAARPLVGDPVVDTLFPPRAQEIGHWVLQEPEALQLAIYAASIGVYTVLSRRGLRPDLLIGHSLGEITALVAAGAFTVAEGAQIVCHRSLVLRESRFGDAYMAVVGTNAQRAQQLIDLVGDHETVIAVENHPAQTVVSGRAETLDVMARLAADLPVDFTRLKSPYPFHSPLLEQAEEKFAGRIRGIRQRPLEIGVHSPIVGRAYTDEDVLTEILASHFTRRVRFMDSIAELTADGAPLFVESGALDALTKIVRRVTRSATTIPTLLPEAGGAAGIARALEHLAELGAVKAPADSGRDLECIGMALIPGVPSSDFGRFWSERGDLVTAFARRVYAEYTVPFETGQNQSQSDPERSRVPLAPRTSPQSPGSQSRGGQPALSLAPSQPPAPGTADRDSILRQLTALYAEALEYPAEVFAEDTELEGELGVDSVKQTELLVRVGERFGLPPRPADFRPGPYGTIGKIADLVLATAASPGRPAAPASEPVPLPVAPAVRGRAEVLGELVALYAQALEYPAEVFAEDTELEGELGVDSVKQTELLVRVGERFGLPPRPADFRPGPYGTIGKIADLVLAAA